MVRLTDRAAIRLALLLAIDTEESLVHAYEDPSGKIPEREPGVILARRNIAAFERVLDRHFNGARKPKLSGGKTISLSEMLRAGPQTFNPNEER
jgi:hypothetical protein